MVNGTYAQIPKDLRISISGASAQNLKICLIKHFKLKLSAVLFLSHKIRVKQMLLGEKKNFKLSVVNYLRLKSVLLNAEEKRNETK